MWQYFWNIESRIEILVKDAFVLLKITRTIRKLGKKWCSLVI